MTVSTEKQDTIYMYVWTDENVRTVTYTLRLHLTAYSIFITG